jgi:hypothetical protein
MQRPTHAPEAVGGRHHGGRGLAPRRARPPRPVVAVWAASVAAGAVLVSVTAVHAAGGGAAATGLAPDTLARYLVAAAGPSARDLRINGVYGSGQAGAWQFVAHMSWRDAAGTLVSAETQLPDEAGTTTPDPSLTGTRLADEERIGWTPTQLQSALGGDRGLANATLAELELQTTDAGSALVSCLASEPDALLLATQHGAAARCISQPQRGGRAPFDDVLVYETGGGPLSIQRDGHLLG